MPISITLTDEQVAQILSGHRDVALSHPLLEEIEAAKKRLRDLECLSEQRACGILDVSRSVLLKTIPRTTIAPGVFRYRVIDIEKHLDEGREPLP